MRALLLSVTMLTITMELITVSNAEMDVASVIASQEYAPNVNLLLGYYHPQTHKNAHFANTQSVDLGTKLNALMSHTATQD
jgi:hypothetical protein